MLCLLFYVGLIFISGDSVNAGNNHEDLITCPDKSLWNAELESLSVDNCPDPKKTCILEKGRNYKLQIKMNPFEKVENVTTVVKGIIAGMALNYDVPQPQIDWTESPVTGKEQITYTAVLPIKLSYPPIHVKVRWDLFDQQERRLACLLIPVRITKAH